ncbi:uncharacterized protein [Nicotiana tomentosiformis]|uniref:uncharacterized protein n=1 Tax=Nicotiana tomentosiformis TaxID=4098 RepID=UPI00388CA027
MFARFSKIIGDLKAFGKPYSGGDQVQKILRSLPTTWQTKVVALESQDLNKLSYDELRGDLITFEKTHLKKTSLEEKKKTICFKSTTKGPENDDDPKALEEEIAMVSRNMNGLMRRYRNTRRGRMPSRRTRQYNKQDKNDRKCYECGRYGHVQVECPDLKRKVSRGFSKNKSFGSWSDEDNSEHEEIENLCFMTILENDMNKYFAAGLMKIHQTMNARKILKTVSWHEVKQARDVLQDEVQELQMQLNGMRKFTSHSSVKSNQATYKSTGKGLIRTESTDGLNYNLLSISELCNSGYEVKFKKTGCAIEDEIGKTILSRKRYGNVYILDGIENLDIHICLASISDDHWL